MARHRYQKPTPPELLDQEHNPYVTSQILSESDLHTLRCLGTLEQLLKKAARTNNKEHRLLDPEVWGKLMGLVSLSEQAEPEVTFSLHRDIRGRRHVEVLAEVISNRVEVKSLEGTTLFEQKQLGGDVTFSTVFYSADGRRRIEVGIALDNVSDFITKAKGELPADVQAALVMRETLITLFAEERHLMQSEPYAQQRRAWLRDTYFENCTREKLIHFIVSVLHPALLAHGRKNGFNTIVEGSVKKEMRATGGIFVRERSMDEVDDMVTACAWGDAAVAVSTDCKSAQVLEDPTSSRIDAITAGKAQEAHATRTPSLFGTALDFGVNMFSLKYNGNQMNDGTVGVIGYPGFNRMKVVSALWRVPPDAVVAAYTDGPKELAKYAEGLSCPWYVAMRIGLNSVSNKEILAWYLKIYDKRNKQREVSKFIGKESMVSWLNRVPLAIFLANEMLSHSIQRYPLDAEIRKKIDDIGVTISGPLQRLNLPFFNNTQNPLVTRYEPIAEELKRRSKLIRAAGS